MWARFFEVYAWWLSLDIRFSRANVLRFYADYSWKWCDVTLFKRIQLYELFPLWNNQVVCWFYEFSSLNIEDSMREGLVADNLVAGLLIFVFV